MQATENKFTLISNQYFLCLFILWSPFVLHARQNMPPAFPIVQDSAEFLPPKTFYQVLEDRSGSYTIKTVSRNPLSQKFHGDHPEIGKTDRSIRYWWFRIVLKNVMEKEARILLPAEGSETDFYLETSNGSWLHQVSGEAIPWSKKDGIKRFNYVPVIIDPGDSVLVYKREHYGYLYHPATFNRPFSVRQQLLGELADGKSYTTIMVISVVVGLIGFGTILGLLLFSVTRQSVYLWFALFLFCEGFTFTEYLDHTIFREFPAFVPVASAIASFVMVYFQVAFMRQFFGTRERFGKWDNVLELLPYFVIGSGVLTMTVTAITGDRNIIMLTQLLGYVPIFFMFIFLLRLVRDANRQMAWVAALALPIFFWWGVAFFAAFIAGQIGVTDNFLFRLFVNLQDGVEILIMSWYVLLFSWALVLRYGNFPHPRPFSQGEKGE